MDSGGKAIGARSLRALGRGPIRALIHAPSLIAMTPACAGQMVTILGPCGTQIGWLWASPHGPSSPAERPSGGLALGRYHDRMTGQQSAAVELGAGWFGSGLSPHAVARLAECCASVRTFADRRRHPPGGRRHRDLRDRARRPGRASPPRPGARRGDRDDRRARRRGRLVGPGAAVPGDLDRGGRRADPDARVRERAAAEGPAGGPGAGGHGLPARARGGGAPARARLAISSSTCTVGIGSPWSGDRHRARPARVSPQR